MTGFKPWTSGIGSDRSTNWATTTANRLFNFVESVSRFRHLLTQQTNLNSARFSKIEKRIFTKVLIYFLKLDWNRN